MGKFNRMKKNTHTQWVIWGGELLCIDVKPEMYYFLFDQSSGAVLKFHGGGVSERSIF